MAVLLQTIVGTCMFSLSICEADGLLRNVSWFPLGCSYSSYFEVCEQFGSDRRILAEKMSNL